MTANFIKDIKIRAVMQSLKTLFSPASRLFFERATVGYFAGAAAGAATGVSTSGTTTQLQLGSLSVGLSALQSVDQ